LHQEKSNSKNNKMNNQFKLTSYLCICFIASNILLASCTEHNSAEKPGSATLPVAVENITAITATTLFTDKETGAIAYRKIGSGEPIILCNRFRGTLDDWDPKFLDQLAQTHTVITFDYRGIGLSNLPQGKDSLMEVADIQDLAAHLGLAEFSLLGWSHGGKVAQVFTAQQEKQVKNLILLGTGPVGVAKFAPEKVFFDYALKPVNNFNDEIVLFFEPKYEESRYAAKLSHDRMHKRVSDTSKYVTPDKFNKYFQTVALYNADTSASNRLTKGKIPILAISGEHDIVFPIEDWYGQTRVNPNLQIIMMPKAGHGPQSQYPMQTARYISGFLAGED
jgi:pimeloyl-ACP methyl ester carboxylesterase